jgi:multiple sugar transport system substrate-binding protein
MRKFRSLFAMVLAIAMLLGVAASASAFSYETVLNPAGEADLVMTLDNLDLDGTLQPGMYAGKKITVAASGGDHAAGLREYAQIFNELTGGEVEVQEFPDQLFEKVQLALQSGGQFDVIEMPIAFLHSFAYAGYLTDIAPMLETVASPGFDVGDFVPSMFETYSLYQGKTIAFPYKPDAQLFFYRKDLFEDPAVQAQYKEKTGNDLKVPETPDEMLEVAAFFTKSLNPDSPVEYGYSTMMSKGSSRFNWFNRLGAFGGREVNEDYTLGFTDGSGLKALEFVLELGKYAPSDWLTFDWDTANTFFAQGNAAMMEQWPGLYLTCNQEGSPTKDKIGYAVTPGQSPTLGGWGLSIVADSPEQEMAFKFCEMATSKDGECIKIQYTFDPCRTSNYERETVKEVSDVYEALGANLAYATQLADTDIPYVSAQCGDVEEVAIQGALSGELTAQEAIDQMAAGLEAIIKDVLEDL